MVLFVFSLGFCEHPSDKTTSLYDLNRGKAS